MELRYKIPCCIIRGGTSRGLYFLEQDLPPEGAERDALLLRAMGSPDKRQIDGLGGATSVTSKVAIVKVSDRPDADVEYTFAQVSVEKPIVSYKGNCGNILSGVGPFAIEKGLVEARAPITEVRIFNTNTGKTIVAEVQVENGCVQYNGSYAIAGVPGTAAPVKLKFLKPAGTLCGRLLPTGNAVDTLEIPDFGTLSVSIVDAANPLVFVRAEDIGLTGTELPQELEQNEQKMELLEKIRGVAAVKLGILEDYTRSAWDMPGIPKMTFVAKPVSYKSTAGQEVRADEVDLVSRMMSMQKPHQTYAMTGAMCTAAAAVVPGSIVAEAMGNYANRDAIRIGHPGGVMEVGVACEPGKDEPEILYTAGYRTANLLMEGFLVCKK